MFQKGEYVVYGSNGICEIEDIANPGFSGVDENRLYYVLEPVDGSGGRIYSPVDNKKLKIRRVMSAEEAEQFIEGIPLVGTLWVENEKKREESYKLALLTEQPEEWVKIIKTLYLRSVDRMKQGKKITTTDEKYLRVARERLYSELGFALGKEKEGMETYIKERIEHLETTK